MSPLDTLSPAEKEVAILTAKGFSGTEISGMRGRDRRTISNQKLNAMNKLGVDSEAMLVQYLLHIGAICNEFDEQQSAGSGG